MIFCVLAKRTSNPKVLPARAPTTRQGSAANIIAVTFATAVDVEEPIARYPPVEEGDEEHGTFNPAGSH